MSYLIQRATKADIPSCIALNIKSMPEAYSEGFWNEKFNQYGNMFFVAKDKNIDEVVGYVLPSIESIYLFKYGFSTVGQVTSLAVSKAYQGMGIATALLDACEKAMKAEGLPFAALQVRVTNTPAINLYMKESYEIVDRLKRYYSDTTDAYLLVKGLY